MIIYKYTFLPMKLSNFYMSSPTTLFHIFPSQYSLIFISLSNHLTEMKNWKRQADLAFCITIRKDIKKFNSTSNVIIFDTENEGFYILYIDYISQNTHNLYKYLQYMLAYK